MSDLVLILGNATVGLFALGGVIYTARSSRAAADKATTVADRSEAANEWDSLVTQLRTEVDRLRPRLEQLEQHRESDRLALRRLDRRLEDYVRRYRAAVRYIVQLQAFIAAHLPGGPEAPKPPDELLFDLDDPDREPSVQWPPRTD